MPATFFAISSSVTAFVRALHSTVQASQVVRSDAIRWQQNAYPGAATLLLSGRRASLPCAQHWQVSQSWFKHAPTSRTVSLSNRF